MRVHVARKTAQWNALRGRICFEGEFPAAELAARAVTSLAAKGYGGLVALRREYMPREKQRKGRRFAHICFLNVTGDASGHRADEQERAAWAAILRYDE